MLIRVTSTSDRPDDKWPGKAFEIDLADGLQPITTEHLGATYSYAAIRVMLLDQSLAAGSRLRFEDGHKFVVNAVIERV